MPDVSPFRGVRYDVARVGTLSDVVAPPYDVIDKALQEQLYQVSPYNVIRLELNRDEPGDSGADERYARAARILSDWLRQGILREEAHPAFYVYEQSFVVDGTRHTRKGFLARVRLEPITGAGHTFRHTARELLALAAWHAGDTAAAKRWIDIINTDPDTLPDERSRVEMLSALLGSEGKS